MIESVNNEKIIFYTKLNEKKYRDREKLFIAPGKHLVEEAIKTCLIKEILLLENEENTFNMDVTYVSLKVMKKVSNLASSPKCLGICCMPNNGNIKGNIIILDDIKDPGNLGTIIRSAVAFNYETIILSKECVDVYNLKSIRSTEGMLFKINIVIGDLEDYISKLKSTGYTIYGTDVVNGNPLVKDKNKHAIVIGSEGAGISDKIKALCDKNLYIKMNDACESLNAGVSASILMYELSKE